MAIADTITSMQNHTSNAYTMIGYGTDLTGINKNLENLSTSIFNAFLEALRTPDTLFTNLPKKSASGSNISLTGVANAPMRIELSPSELSQSGTPTPSSPQEVHTISGDNTIKVEGKNLFDKSKVIGGWISKTNRVYNSSTDTYNYIDYIKVKPNTTYTLNLYNKTGLSSGAVLEYNDNKELIQEGILETEQVITFTTTNTTKYVRFTTRVDSNNYVQFEEGNTATTYEPYTSQEAEINLGTNLIGLDNAQYKVNLKAGDKIFATNQTDASLTLNLYTNYGDTTRNDYWSLSANGTRAITVANDTKAIAWSTQVSRTNKGIAWVNLGDAQKPYNSYIEPINYSKIGTYKDEFIRTNGKNLLDTQYFQQGSIDSSTGQDTSNSYNARGSNYIEVLPNTTYTISTNVNVNTLRLSEYNSSKEHIQRDSTNNSKSLTITTTANTHYVRWSLNYNNSTQTTQTLIDGLELMLNKGSMALDYEPYGNGTWYIKKNIGKVVLDGTESWGYEGGRFVLSFKISALDTSGRQPAYSNYFGYLPSGSADYGIFIYKASATNYQIYIYDKDYTTTSDFQTWLSTHNLILYYILNTPTYTQITGTLETQLENVYQKLLSYTGQTNISQINNDLPFIMNVSAIEV